MEEQFYAQYIWRETLILPTSNVIRVIMRSIALLLSIGIFFMAPGCDSGSADRDDLAALEAEILQMIGDASASDVSFCREIAFGSKPCGGPWKYLVYSTAKTDSLALANMVAKYNQMEKDINERDGGVSDCAFVVPPGVALSGGTCVVAPQN